MSITNLYNALLKAQTEYPRLVKDSTNPHFKNDYLSLDGLLDAILPVLNANGVLVFQAPTVIGDEPALRTALVHAESGEGLEDKMLLVLDRDSSQGQGSAITYARRYALMSMLGLAAADDDDGEGAAAPTTSTSTKKTEQFEF